MTTINALPLPAPSRSMDAPTFINAMDATLAALPPLVTQINLLAGEMNANAVAASQGATLATEKAASALASESASATSASNAAISAASAAATAMSLTATSATSNAIATGNMTFSIAAGKQFAAGQFMIAVSNGNTANYVYGRVVSYVGTSLILNVTDIGGGGTKTDWVLSVAGIKGAIGTSASTVSQTLADAATVNWDSSLGRIGALTLAGNRSMALPSNRVADTYILYVTQDATGSRTLTWNSGFKWAGGAAPILSTTPNAKDVFSFICDGANFYGSYLRGVA